MYFWSKKYFYSNMFFFFKSCFQIKFLHLQPNIRRFYAKVDAVYLVKYLKTESFLIKVFKNKHTFYHFTSIMLCSLLKIINNRPTGTQCD